MAITFSTASLAGVPGQAAGLDRLRQAGLEPIELGPVPGDLAGPVPGVATARLAFLPDEMALPNLSSADDDLRRKAVRSISEAVSRCEWLGIPEYACEAGWSLTQTLLRDGTGAGKVADRRHALAQLERSLDRLAAHAQERRVALLVAAMPPAGCGLLANPREIKEVLSAVGAPDLRVSLDLADWAATAAEHRFSPDEGAAELGDLVGQLRFPDTAISRPVGWMVDLVRAKQGVPVVLAFRDTSPGRLREGAAWLEEALHAAA